MTLLRSFVLVALLAVLSCTDEGPVSGPGTLTATLVGPEGADGAAVLVLVGEGVGEVTSDGPTEVHARQDGTTTRVVLIDQVGGQLAFRVALADTTQLPEAIIQQVAGPNDSLRSIDQYRLEFSR